MIKRIPVPIAGVMLGFAALGNLLQSYSENIRMVCGVIAVVLGLLLLLKLICYPGMIKEDLKNPIMASVAATFPMALMLLSTYIKPYLGAGALYIWYFAIVLHIIMIIYFTAKFIIKLDIKKVFASYFIVYVGIAVAAITAPAYEKTSIGTIAFWFGFVCLLVLLVLVGYRYIKYREIPAPAQPLFCIFTAPASLCLTGYVQSVMPKSKEMIGFMAILASLLYLLVLIRLPQYLRLPFFPSYAAFTFPFVISAIALKQTSACLANMGSPIGWLQYAVSAETVIAVILVIYTFVRYIMFLINTNQ